MGALRSVPLKAGVWAALFVLQVLLMIFFVTGEDVHEYLAFPFAALALLHMAIASWWLKTFGRQFATPRQALNSGIDLALVAALLLALVSGLLISRYVLPILRARAVVRLRECAKGAKFRQTLLLYRITAQFEEKRIRAWAKDALAKA